MHCKKSFWLHHLTTVILNLPQDCHILQVNVSSCAAAGIHKPISIPVYWSWYASRSMLWIIITASWEDIQSLLPPRGRSSYVGMCFLSRVFHLSYHWLWRKIANSDKIWRRWRRRARLMSSISGKGSFKFKCTLRFKLKMQLLRWCNCAVPHNQNGYKSQL